MLIVTELIELSKEWENIFIFFVSMSWHESLEMRTIGMHSEISVRGIRYILPKQKVMAHRRGEDRYSLIRIIG